jgi:hypothetical protein
VKALKPSLETKILLPVRRPRDDVAMLANPRKLTLRFAHTSNKGLPRLEKQRCVLRSDEGAWTAASTSLFLVLVLLRRKTG